MRTQLFTPLLTLLFSALAFAAPATGEFNQAEFEKRFNAADTGKTGKLSRQAAYKAFPRAPEFFDEVDRNKDNFITIKEVNQALDRRWEAAMKSNKYNLPATPQTAPAGDAVSGNQDAAYSSKAEAQRAHRYEYYESLAGDLESSRLRNQPTQPEPYPTLIKKSF
jgi:hypothetical protein